MAQKPHVSTLSLKKAAGFLLGLYLSKKTFPMLHIQI